MSESQAKPPSPSSYRRHQKNVTETADYGLLLENEGGDGTAMKMEDVATGDSKGKGKQRAAVQTYAEGGNESGDVGGEYMMSEEERERRRKEKGKGRMQVESAAAEEDEEEEQPPVFPPELADEEAREEKRIADNLAKWSKAEATRRKSVRKSAALITPSAPPLPLPSATNLARRSSALIRAGSKRLGRTTQSSHAEELVNMPVDGAESRRSQRRGSMPLDDRADSPSTAEQMERLVNEDTSVPSKSFARPLTPPQPPAINPFVSPPPSPMRTASFDTTTSVDARHHSRFVEDLPLQSPNTSPTKPTSFVYGLSRTSLESPIPSPSPSTNSRNPFADGFAMHTKPRRPTEMLVQRGSQASLASQSTITPTMRSQSTKEGPNSTRASTDEEARMYRGSEYATSSRQRNYEEEEEEEEEEEVDDVGVGWLDWLLCGCFRAQDGDEQVGRTNPNE